MTVRNIEIPGSEPFRMLSREAFAGLNAAQVSDMLRVLVREIATTVQAQRRRVDGLEAKFAALERSRKRDLKRLGELEAQLKGLASNERRGLLQ